MIHRRRECALPPLPLPFPKDVCVCVCRCLLLAQTTNCAQEFHRSLFSENFCPINISLPIKKDLSDKNPQSALSKNSRQVVKSRFRCAKKKNVQKCKIPHFKLFLSSSTIFFSHLPFSLFPSFSFVAQVPFNLHFIQRRIHRRLFPAGYTSRDVTMSRCPPFFPPTI